MIRGLLKLVVLVVVIVVIGAFVMGRWSDGGLFTTGGTRPPGSAAPSEKVRAVGDRAGQAADATRRAIAEGSLTAKIKAKMALDDHVKALNLDVDTVGSIVTVTGVVNSQAERERALLLARDTEGVTQVVDKLTVKKM
ncbi:MAG: BON domain-containing protein [Vicinamibacterales bacterium]